MRALAMLGLSMFGLVLGGACANFDREDRIEDLRVLAIRTEPAEILYSPLFLTPIAQRGPEFQLIPLPTVEVTVDVFAFDPRRGRIASSIKLCPEGSGDSACRVYDPAEDLRKEPEAVRPEIESLLIGTSTDAAGVEVSDPGPLGRIREYANMTFPFTPGVIDFIIPDTDEGQPIPSLFPALPRIVFQAENLDIPEAEVREERAFKRIPVTLDLASEQLPADVRADLARTFGFELCTTPITAEERALQAEASCLEARAPNQNPRLVGFFLDTSVTTVDPLATQSALGFLTDDVIAPDIGVSSLLRANPGDVVTITPIFKPDTQEGYQVMTFAIEESRVVLVNRTEDIACNWYTTGGDVTSTLTGLQLGDSLGVSWQLPADGVPGERETLLMVVLDQRGGTSVADVTVEYR